MNGATRFRGRLGQRFRQAEHGFRCFGTMYDRTGRTVLVVRQESAEPASQPAWLDTHRLEFASQGGAVIFALTLKLVFGQLGKSDEDVRGRDLRRTRCHGFSRSHSQDVTNDVVTRHASLLVHSASN